MAGDAGAEAAGAQARFPSPVRMWTAAAVVVVALAIVAWVFWPGFGSGGGGDGVGAGAGGPGRIGAAPGGATAGTGDAPSEGPGASGVTPLPNTPGGSPPLSTPTSRPLTPGPSPGQLIATYTFSDLAPVNHSINVVVGNVGGTDVIGWTVTFVFSDLGLLVISDTKSVNHDIKGRQHIFTPTDETLMVPAGGSVRFALAVAVLPTVESCTIDGWPCIAG